MRASSNTPRCVLSVLGILCLIITCTAISSPVLVAQEAAAPAKQAEAQPAKAEVEPISLSPIEKAEKDGTALRLSLKDITKLALQNNLEIAIQDTNEQLSRQKIIGSFGDYDPKLTGQLGYQSRKNANTTSYDYSSESFNKNDTAQWNFTFSQAVKTGGTLQAQFNSNRTASNSNSAVFNPSYGSTLTVQFTQPLWRNFRIDSTRGNIKIVNLDLDSTESKFRQKVTETISSIQGQYWDLVSAIRDYDIKRDSVKLGQITLQNNRKKVEVGTLAPIGITEAEADLKSRELSLISSEETILRQENALRQLISNNRKAEIWSKVIIPTDSPAFQEYKVDLNTAIDTALRNRPELEQYDIQLKQSDINLMTTHNSRKWKFDLTGSFGSNGTAGPQGCQKDQFTGLCKNDINGNPILLTPTNLVGGLGTSYKTMFTEGFTNWQIAFQLEIPLRHRSLDTQLVQYKIQKQQTLMNRRSQEQSIQVEIRNAVQKLETNKKQVETAAVQTRLNKEQYEAEQKRFDAGLSENFRVLDRQNQLAQAEATELTNLITYKKSVISLQKAMYTLLESNEFEVAKGSSNNVPDLK
jgi:outer membrane protein